MNAIAFLSGNQLKIIAAITMLIDHIGFIFFPDLVILRIIGRISFPIFAYMIAEGCVYTKNKQKYFLGIASLAALCQIVYFFYSRRRDMSILVTFALSVLVIYSLQYFKECLFSDVKYKKKLAAFFLMAFAVIFVYIFSSVATIEYGFWGCMMPVFASIFRKGKCENPGYLMNNNCLSINLIMMGIAMLLLCLESNTLQFYSFFALPLLMLYSGNRGKMKMKMFFYIFYPTHIAALELINTLIERLS